MKLEYLSDGSPECPLVRIYDFDSVAAEFLRRHIVGLTEGSLTVVAVHEFSTVQPIGGCQLLFKINDVDRGVIQLGTTTEFECLLTRTSWRQVAGLMEPFCTPVGHPGSHQWLDETSDISLLFSPDGQW